MFWQNFVQFLSIISTAFLSGIKGIIAFANTTIGTCLIILIATIIIYSVVLVLLDNLLTQAPAELPDGIYNTCSTGGVIANAIAIYILIGSTLTSAFTTLFTPAIASIITAILCIIAGVALYFNITHVFAEKICNYIDNKLHEKHRSIRTI